MANLRDGRSLEGRLTDLETKGFVVMRSFLTPEEVALLIADHAERAAKPRANRNYDVVLMLREVHLRFEAKLATLARRVEEATSIVADLPTLSVYFSTRGTNFGWHQDHESYYMFQSSDYLNFYVPIVKPDPKRSNLCVVPYDALATRAPDQWLRLRGSGAKRFDCGNSKTEVSDDENDEQFTLPVDLEEIKAVPELSAGDLLLCRGDVIHRTQDAETHRIAASFRRMSSSTVLRRTRLLSGGSKKRQMLENFRIFYDRLLRCFEDAGAETITVGQLYAFAEREQPFGVRSG